MKYIPQAPPFEMIDQLVKIENGHTTTQLTILAENILVHNQYLTTAGLIENMAQTAAAGSGFESYNNNEAPKVGFIGAIKDFSANRLPKVGETITTTISPLHTIGNVQIVRGEVILNNEIIASAEYKIFLNEA